MTIGPLNNYRKKVVKVKKGQPTVVITVGWPFVV